MYEILIVWGVIVGPQIDQMGQSETAKQTVAKSGEGQPITLDARRKLYGFVF